MKAEVSDKLINFINVCKEVWNKREHYTEFDYPEYMGICSEWTDLLDGDEVDAIQYILHSVSNRSYNKDEYCQDKFVADCLDFVSSGMSLVWFGENIKIHE